MKLMRIVVKMLNDLNQSDMYYNVFDYIYNDEKIEEFISYLDNKKFRIKQIKKWIFEKLEFDFDNMSDLPKKYREFLKNYFNVVNLKIENVLTEKKSETVKFGLKTQDNNIIEMVILTDTSDNNKIRKNKRYTLCISSQIGCPVGCKFCATGLSGYLRNLTYSEILSQFLIAENYLKGKGKIDNIVFMGMGEPLLNLDNVLKTIEILGDKEGRMFSPKRITISTVGIISGLKKLLSINKNFKLAFSLHTPFNEQRKSLIPYNQDLKKLLDLFEKYREKTKKRVGIEYIIFKGVNDSKKHIEELIPIVKKLGNYINLIEYNPVSGLPFNSPDRDKVHYFQEQLEKNNINVSIRYKRGRDIKGACGQLRWKKKN